MILGVADWAVLALAVAVAAGALVQGTTGLGLGLVAAPVATLLVPQLVPAVLLWLGVVMAGSTLWFERSGVDWRGLAWSLPPRVLGTAVGVWVLGHLGHREIGVAVAVMVALSVLLTWRTVELPITPVTLPVAGLVSGVTGTTTSIGGPPMAVLYQHRPAAVVRPTLAVYFVAGGLMSLTGLALGGRLDPRSAALGLLLLPALLAGLWLAVRHRNRLSGPAFRAAIQLVCLASALVLLARSLL